jgi:hypothetical protein
MIYNQTICQVGYDFIPISDSSKTNFGIDRFISDFNNYPNWLNFYKSIDKKNERLFVNNMIKAYELYDSTNGVNIYMTVNKISKDNWTYKIEIAFPKYNNNDGWRDNEKIYVPTGWKVFDKMQAVNNGPLAERTLFGIIRWTSNRILFKVIEPTLSKGKIIEPTLI